MPCAEILRNFGWIQRLIMPQVFLALRCGLSSQFGNTFQKLRKADRFGEMQRETGFKAAGVIMIVGEQSFPIGLLALD
jgi:hypothetical protein